MINILNRNLTVHLAGLSVKRSLISPSSYLTSNAITYSNGLPAQDELLNFSLTELMKVRMMAVLKIKRNVDLPCAAIMSSLKPRKKRTRQET